MREVLRSNDLVHLSFVEATLKGVDIGCVVMDAHTSAIEGSIGAIPRRVLVLDEDHALAVRTLIEAGAMESGG